MGELSQEEFDELRRDAEPATCPDGQEHMFVDRLKFINRGAIYTVGECENCHEFDWMWHEADDPTTKVSKEGIVL